MKYYRVPKLVEDCSEVDMRYCATGDMVANGLTKGLDLIKQVAFVRMATDPEWNYYAAVYGAPA